MKPNRDSAELAARITAAAIQAPPLPAPPAPVVAPPAAEHTPSDRAERVQTPPKPPVSAASSKASTRQRRGGGGQSEESPSEKVASVPITLRPPKTLLDRYVNAAADRTRAAGRVVSAQEIMLEQLERGPT